jgi:hypothetical protein
VRAWIGIGCAGLLLAGSGCGNDGAGGDSASSSFGSADFVSDGPARRAVIWAVGDADAGAAGRAVGRLLARGKPDVVLYLGDVYESGSADDFRDNYAPTLGKLASRTAPTPGNHDWPNRDEGYIPYWREARRATPPPFYSFTAGGWQLLSLNSEIGASSDQMRWLRTRLRPRGACRLAFWHRPRYSAGRHGDSAGVDPFWRALRGHARLVVSGHDHDMQRMRPRNGLVQLVSGAGGHSHYEVARGDPAIEFGDDSHFGALRIVLRPGSARLDFISTRGKTLDSTRVRC